MQHLDERISQLRTRKDRLRRRDTAAARKKDTRRKILLGARLIAAVQAGDADAARWLHRLAGELPERDRPLALAGHGLTSRG